MWELLALALLLLAFRPKWALMILLVTVIAAIIEGVLDWRALLWGGMAGVIAVIQLYYKPGKGWRLLTEALMVGSALALTLHLMPGFHNLKVLDSVQVSPDSQPFSLYYNFDKALVPFVLLCCLKSLFYTPNHPRVRWQWLLLIVCVPGILLVATLAGALRMEFHMPVWLPQFIMANVFFVALAEEGLFRGHIQQRLTQFMHPVLALVIAALLFGALHYKGGILLVLFSALAGIIYGLAWMWSGRLWVAVLFHVAVDLTQLLFFTYPALMHVSGMAPAGHGG
ncbi:CAAX protease family protein [Erwinia sp. OLTSP20]|uniref:CPBP family intramembrane glutamic endopeptidase n=1 Tax=unclassified Erwinia TaxID=2622719 RepID=UPI000C17A9D8|nr:MULTISPECIES: CPBP family intramembrane glutamic endopeptidase [unclassified Erwinia]PIJ51661.1 CAAX protease family protein [Erwinia sp. OAMSP11]PIJ75548.1 CAAX protease family protein [Erwinia sp. OLSSP12]PIJ84852.1 CAAX protease family protein [Erwinia sp. OLCASP19]PIJ86631.1 CAAX protease family protein [Erwinia sp. OLMTSP26]PIJ88072.1 CAAX protease family protein [Erwinia sp. OLMDSP33]